MIESFNEFFERFRETPLWNSMMNTHENSPWHREKDVSVHSRMVLRHYTEHIAAERTPEQQALTLVAALFHDVAKPRAEVTKRSEERGEYRSYGGHEQLSARIWIDYALTHQKELERAFGFELAEISYVALMLEHHVPFALKDERKRRALKRAFLERGGVEGHQAWLDLLNSDQRGRTSDDQETKLAAVAEWMKEWEKV